MTPQLQQAIKLLQMTTVELCQYLENQQSETFLEIETSIDSKSRSGEENNKNENITSNISDEISKMETRSLMIPPTIKIMKTDMKLKLTKDQNLIH